MQSLNIGFIAIVTVTLLLLFYSGMLFDPALVRRQFDRANLRDLGHLALANYLLVPLLTLGIIRVFAFPPELNLVLLTMAMLPCAAIVPPFVSMVGEAPERSLFVFIAMSLLNIAATPILMALLTLPWVMGDAITPHGGEIVALCKYLASVFMPMGLGAALRVFAPRHCASCQPRLQRMLLWLLPLSIVLFAYSCMDQIRMLGWRDFEALLLFEAACVAIGMALASRMPGQHVATVLICGLRNTAMGLAFALVAYPHTAAPTYMLVFITLSFLGAMVGLGLWKRFSAAPVA